MSPAAPRLAATVIPLRQGPAGPEVLMLRRSGRARFMAHAYVFPGGAVDASDGALPCRGGERDARRMGRHDALAVMAAGLRELYEEAGLLLAAGDLPDGARAQLLRGELGFGQLCTAQGLCLELDRLALWAHWLTPEAQPIRFDAWFFVTELPPDSVAEHDRGETVDSLWIAPQQAIERSWEGDFFLPPPTFRTLEELAALPTVRAILHAAPARPLPPVMPRFERLEDGVLRALLPGDARYPSERPAPGPKRLRQRGSGWVSEEARPPQRSKQSPKSQSPRS